MFDVQEIQLLHKATESDKLANNYCVMGFNYCEALRYMQISEVG